MLPKMDQEERGRRRVENGTKVSHSKTSPPSSLNVTARPIPLSPAGEGDPPLVHFATAL